MGSGKEGSPSPAAALGERQSLERAGSKAGDISASLQHRLEREELLAGGSNPPTLDLSILPPGGVGIMSLNDSAKRLHSPRGGGSPRSGSPLPSLKEPAPMDTVDLQGAIQRGVSSSRKSPMRMRLENDAELHMDRVPISSGTISAIPDARQRTAAGSRRYKTETLPTQEESLTLARGWKPDILQPEQEIGLPAAPDLGFRGRGRSPRGARIAMTDMPESSQLSSERPSSKAMKSLSRRVKTEALESQEADLPAADMNKVVKRSHTRQHTRQHKRKAADPLPALPPVPPESYLPERPSQQFLEPSRTSASSASRRAAREARSFSESSDWLQFAVDIIMWTHIPRSWLLFGVGCFCILSASVVQDMHYSIVSAVAYLALIYLAAVFFRHSIARGANSETRSSFSYELNEADALKVIKTLLPAINSILRKLSQLFSGDPGMTLKVAVSLWVLAQAGYMMSLWTLARLAYFALFIIPKCYSCYHNQLRGYIQNLFQWGSVAWNSCSYKKAALFVVFAMAWSFFSTLSRIFGAFLLVVALRVYQQNVGNQQHDPNLTPHEGERSADMDGAASNSFESVRVPEAASGHNL